MSWYRYQDESPNVQSVKLHLEGETGVEGGAELVGKLHAELGTLRLGGVAVRKAIGRLAHNMTKRGPSPTRTSMTTSKPWRSEWSTCAASFPTR